MAKDRPKRTKPPKTANPAAWNAYLADQGLGVIQPKRIVCTRGKQLRKRRKT